MYGTIHMYGTVHIDGSMTWYWPMMWHWLMRCHDPVGLKFLCTVDRWHGSILVDQKSRIRYMHIHRIIFNQTVSLFKPCGQTVLLFKPRGQTAYCWLMMWRNPEHPKYFWSDGHDLLNVSIKSGLSPPNLASLNPFLGSIFCNSFSILYFLHILINSYFAPSSIMSS